VLLSKEALHCNSRRLAAVEGYNVLWNLRFLKRRRRCKFSGVLTGWLLVKPLQYVTRDSERNTEWQRFNWHLSNSNFEVLLDIRGYVNLRSGSSLTLSSLSYSYNFQQSGPNLFSRKSQSSKSKSSQWVKRVLGKTDLKHSNLTCPCVSTLDVV